MNTSRSFNVAFLMVIVLLISACGPTYVQPQAQYEYNPGYNPNNVVADAIITAAIINGVTGYHYGGAFYPQAYYGGVPGYYVGGRFHTSREYHTTIVNNYNTGHQAFQRNPQAYAQQNPKAVAVKPNYSSNTGGVSRGPATQTPQQVSKPNYGSYDGGVTRGPVATSKPNYGGYNGGVSRSPVSQSPTSTYSAPAKPSYSSGSGSAYRSSPSFSRSSTSSSSSSSSSMGRSSRR